MCMKKLMKWANKAVKKMNIWDVGMLKTYVFLVGMVIGALIPVFVMQYVWYFVGAAVVLALILWKRVLI